MSDTDASRPVSDGEIEEIKWWSNRNYAGNMKIGWRQPEPDVAYLLSALQEERERIENLNVVIDNLADEVNCLQKQISKQTSILDKTVKEVGKYKKSAQHWVGKHAKAMSDRVKREFYIIELEKKLKKAQTKSDEHGKNNE